MNRAFSSPALLLPIAVGLWLVSSSARAQTAGEAADSREVIVNGTPASRDVSEIRLSAAQARREPGTQGDPIQVIEDLPGVARARFGSDQLVLWGAAPEDTRVYVDGVEIPNLFHGGGVRGTINGDMLKSVTVTPGAYGADYGHAIGGLVRLETRELSRDSLNAVVDLNTLDGSALVSAPLGERVRLAVAARYGWLGHTLSAVNAPDVGALLVVPRYHDYQGKLQLDLRDGEALDFTLLGSSDDSAREIGSADPARWRRSATHNAFERISARYRRSFTDGASVEIVPWIGRDTQRTDANFDSAKAALEQRSFRFGVRAEHRSFLAGGLSARLGLDFDGTHANLYRSGSLLIPAREGDVTVFGQPPGDDINVDDWHTTTLDVAPYAVFDWEVGPLTLSPGLRFDGYLLETSRKTPRVGLTPAIGQSALDARVEPRMAARFRLSHRVALFGAAGIYSQPPSATDLSAVFGTPTLGPESASHLSLGESVELSDRLSANVTGFYRALSDLSARDPAPTPRLSNALLASGSGRSYGVQVLIRQRPWHGFFGWLAYTVSRSERRDIPGGSARLFDYDEPHLLTLVASKELAEWTVGIRFRYASGAPRTPVVAAFYNETSDRFEPLFGAHNSQRLPAFWQTDVGVERRLSLGRQTRIVLSLELLNVTNHVNAEEFAYSGDYTQSGTITGLPFLGVLGARLER